VWYYLIMKHFLKRGRRVLLLLHFFLTSPALIQAATDPLEVIGSPQRKEADAGSMESPILGSSELTNFGGCICEPEHCSASKVLVALEHGGSNGSDGLSLATLSQFLQAQPVEDRIKLVPIASMPLACVDDRLPFPSLATPGGDLGEFIIALDAYLDSTTARQKEATSITKGAAPKRKLTDEMVQMYLTNFMESTSKDRSFIHCTDDRAVHHLEQELQVRSLDLNAPPEHVKENLLTHLTEAENQGDSHIRLMLEHPEWYHLAPDLVPTVLRAFYGLLWNKEPHARLLLLQGESKPKAFIEVSANPQCEKAGMAPLIDPRMLPDGFFMAISAGMDAFISHMNAASARREELATFFARVANMTPHKLDKASLKDRMDRHGYMALDTTGKRIAGDLPFFSVTFV